jgi:hypothetical protein
MKNDQTPGPDDRREEPHTKQTDEPWKKNPQNVTDPSLPDTPKPDLEKWNETRTH